MLLVSCQLNLMTATVFTPAMMTLCSALYSPTTYKSEVLQFLRVCVCVSWLIIWSSHRAPVSAREQGKDEERETEAKTGDGGTSWGFRKEASTRSAFQCRSGVPSSLQRGALERRGGEREKQRKRRVWISAVKPECQSERPHLFPFSSLFWECKDDLSPLVVWAESLPQQHRSLSF